MQYFVQWLLRNRALQHVLFWGVSFYILLRHFAYADELTRADWVYAILFHLSLLTVVYINLLILIPRLLQNGRYIWYGLAWLVTLALGISLNNLIFNTLADQLFPGYYFISYFEWSDLAQYMLVYLAATTLLKLSKAWFGLREAERKLKQLQSEKLNAELSALKSQVEPHFLLNNLNCIYALALDRDSRTPEAILKLAQNLRYMLYECNADQVQLDKEITYIQNYLDLQRLRSKQLQEAIFETEIADEKISIAPLLFIPFIENAFKHGTASSIRISLRANTQTLDFSTFNTNKSQQPELENPHQGIGLQNIKRRLELLYPGQYQLDINDQEAYFSVQLKLHLS